MVSGEVAKNKYGAEIGGGKGKQDAGTLVYALIVFNGVEEIKSEVI